jgi:hypothetical protein
MSPNHGSGIFDALAWFPAARVLLAVPPGRDAYWLERGLLAKERSLTTIKVAQIIVPPMRPEAERDSSGDRVVLL